MMRDPKPEPTIPVDNLASDVPAAWHWHTYRVAVDGHTPIDLICHGTSIEAARDGHAARINRRRTKLAVCTNPGESGRCQRDDCWTCTSHALIDQAIDAARATPPEHLHHLRHTYSDRPCSPAYHCVIEAVLAKYCQAN